MKLSSRQYSCSFKNCWWIAFLGQATCTGMGFQDRLCFGQFYESWSYFVTSLVVPGDNSVLPSLSTPTQRRKMYAHHQREQPSICLMSTGLIEHNRANRSCSILLILMNGSVEAVRFHRGSIRRCLRPVPTDFSLVWTTGEAGRVRNRSVYQNNLPKMHLVFWFIFPSFYVVLLQ